MRLYFTASLIGLASAQVAQIPLRSPLSMQKRDFSLKEGADTFSPKDLIELGRPSAGTANLAGDLVLVSYSQYSFEEKKNEKSIYIAPLESSVSPLHIALAKGGEAFWIDTRTVAHVVEGSDKNLEIYAINLNFETQAPDFSSSLVSDEPKLIGTLPTTTATNFRYVSGHLVFSDKVYADGNLSSIAKNDELYDNRGNSGLVYDETFERHWDAWTLPKSSSLFTVSLVQDPNHDWHLGSDFINTLKDTGHSSPVEPFGGLDDFDVSPTSIVYTTKDPKLPVALHTKQNVYIIDILATQKPKELTSGKQAATHSPIFNQQNDKVAWLELDTDGYESDRAKIVIYDLKKDVRFTLTQKWDRSPDSLAFSKEGSFIYFTAGDEAKTKVFVLPVPPTPEHSTTDPALDEKYLTPVALTHKYAASGLQTLFGGRLIFSQSSLIKPNDVHIMRGLYDVEQMILKGESLPLFDTSRQITNFTSRALSSKNLSHGEEFWFKGANDKNVEGWLVKPKGWKEGEKAKFPIAFLVHGGPQSAWQDQWSTRWNPNVFAQQGYFTVFVNPTGSSTFGQEFIDAIAGDWGGAPFVDLLAGFKYILNKYPEIDAERAVAAGASWGGYAMNWIQSNPELGFNFKALVCHDGVFDSTYNGFATDELFFFNHDWKGRPWEKRSKALAEKFNPSNFAHKWSTPQLLIHGSKDFRIPETDSIGAFHVLQQLGVPSRLLVFPDENHWVMKHGNSLKWHHEVFKWFDQFVGESK